jgi:site-specific recombinase XerD
MPSRQNKPQKNRWGSVRPYTRHTNPCRHKGDSNFHDCRCPKWLYLHKRGQMPQQFSLNTPSWAEAMELAAEHLRLLDPEIAAARAAKKSEEQKTLTIADAIQLWLDRTASERGRDSSTYAQYRSTFGWVDGKGQVHGTLLKFIEEYNAEHPDALITTINQMGPLVCQRWRDSHWFGELSGTTRNNRWGVVRSFFNFLFERGVVQSNPALAIKRPPKPDYFAHVPFTSEQYKAILEQADWCVDDRVRDGEREVYCRRLRQLIELLRQTGMDLIDAVLFAPSVQIKIERIDSVSVPVLRYHRTKTGVAAVVPVPRAVAEMLEHIPSVPQSSTETPFRYRGNLIKSDVHNWSRRIHKLFELADIAEVQLLRKDGNPAFDEFGTPITKPPDVKMFRHTFAVACLSAGMREEAVAKMLGHVSTDMVRKYYAPWCKQRDDAHVREVHQFHRRGNAEAKKQKKNSP